jgi:hypothetical protein
MRFGAIQDPRPVMVRFPEGTEEIGIMIADDLVEVGMGGLPMDVRQSIELDGEIFYITGMTKSVALDPAGISGAEVTVRLRVETGL